MMKCMILSDRFMMKLLCELGKKLNKSMAWKYSATSHGKGVVDGIGGRVKFLVRQKALSGEVIQSPKDFAATATTLMTKRK